MMAIVLGAALAVIAARTPLAQAQVTINEIRIDQPGVDNDEYVELTGPAGTSLTGMTYIVIGDDTFPGPNGSGVIEAVVDLTGQTIPPSGFFVFAESTFSLGTADFTAVFNFENSDNVTHVLVSGFTGMDTQDLDVNDDGTLDIMPWTAVVDSIGLVETVGTGDLLYSANLVGPDVTFVPGHVFRFPDSTGGWNIGQFSLTAVPAFDTPGAANVEPIGSCCTDIGGGVFSCAAGVVESGCQALGQIFRQGPGETCLPNPCPDALTGACCDSLGLCTATTEFLCVRGGGAYQGDGILCSSNPCALTCSTIANARAGVDGTPFQLCTVVVGSTTDLVNSAASKNFHIQTTTTGGPGITVFGSNILIDGILNGVDGTAGTADDIVPGSVITIEGATSSFNGLLELTNSPRALVLVGPPVLGGPAPTPVAITAADLADGSPTAEGLESVLVTMGCVVFLDGNGVTTFQPQTNYVVTDGTNFATVRIAAALPFLIGTPLPVGPVDVSGVVSQFDPSVPQNGGYNLLPRGPADIVPAACATVACCLVDGTCRQITAAQCTGAAGIGNTVGGPTCPPTPPCPVNPFGACCLPDGTCVDGLLLSDCLAQAGGGAFLGAGTACAGGGCANLLTVAQARALPLGTFVTLRDPVVASTQDTIGGTFTSIHVQDASGPGGDPRGISVFGTDAQIITGVLNGPDGLPGTADDVVAGDRIMISGTLGEFNGLLEVNGFSGPVTLLQEYLNPPGIPAPTPITMPELQTGSVRAEELESTLIKLDCVSFVPTPLGVFAVGNFQITDGTLFAFTRIGEASIDLVGQPIPTGVVDLTGILSQFDPVPPLDGGYQILLRSSADITAATCLCPTCPGDMDGSNKADSGDIGLFVTELLNPTADPCADISGPGGTPDGNIDGHDLTAFIALVVAADGQGGSGTFCPGAIIGRRIVSCGGAGEPACTASRCQYSVTNTIVPGATQCTDPTLFGAIICVPCVGQCDVFPTTQVFEWVDGNGVGTSCFFEAQSIQNFPACSTAVDCSAASFNFNDAP
ncbi:MAG: hypothetical protein ACE5F9_07475 [Phycisphaerae bacterium]